MAGSRCRVIVLAAQRKGVVNDLAQRFGVSHKCLVPLGGRPLIAHVVDTLAGYSPALDIVVSVETDAFDRIAPALPPGVRCIAAADNLADSVLAAAAGHDGPLLITTADHALLDPASLTAVLRALRHADVAIAMAPRDAVLAAHPEGQRRFYRFRDDAFSNCNLYGIAMPAALHAAEIFRGGGQFAKKASRIIDAFGLLNLVFLRFRLLTLQQAMARISARIRLPIAPVVLTDGSQAIDVDNDRTYRIVEELLEGRRTPQSCEVSFDRNAGFDWPRDRIGAWIAQ